MDQAPAHSPAGTPTAEPLLPREELLVARAGPWRLLVPLRHVERIHPAALPAARPSAGAELPVLTIDGAALPVVFAAALLGADEARLAAGHQLVALGAGGRRALLWVDGIEDVVEHAPAASPPGPRGELVAGWSGQGTALAVLDVPALLARVG
jgi:hypothetical protein